MRGLHWGRKREWKGKHRL